MIDTAVILAGGFGTRLRSVVNDVPKPMAPVNGVPFLTYQLKFLQHYGVKKVIMSVGHLAEVIVSHYRQSFGSMSIEYAKEESPLGTGGAIRFALQGCEDEEVLVLNGDSFFGIDLARLVELHQLHGADASLALREVDDASRYGTVKLTGEDRVEGFAEKKSDAGGGLINAGIYVLNRSAFLTNTPAGEPFSIERDFFEKHAHKLVLYGFRSEGYFIDIGIPEDYNKAQHDFKGFEY